MQIFQKENVGLQVLVFNHTWEDPLTGVPGIITGAGKHPNTVSVIAFRNDQYGSMPQGFSDVGLSQTPPDDRRKFTVVCVPHRPRAIDFAEPVAEQPVKKGKVGKEPAVAS